MVNVFSLYSLGLSVYLGGAIQASWLAAPCYSNAMWYLREKNLQFQWCLQPLDHIPEIISALIFTSVTRCEMCDQPGPRHSTANTVALPLLILMICIEDPQHVREYLKAGLPRECVHPSGQTVS